MQGISGKVICMKKNKFMDIATLTRLAVSTIAVICFLGGCGAEARLPEDPILYEWGTNKEEGHSYLKYEDKIFVPYCPYEVKYLGDCIGYCDIPADEDTDASRVYIFEFKGYSSDEWVIETLGLNNCNEGMIFREISTEEIPEGLTSEYEWNK